MESLLKNEVIRIAKKRRKSITQQIMKDVVKELNKHQHDLTRQQYIRDFKRYVVYCRQLHNVKTLEETKAYIQEYADYLTYERQLSASTVHTYLASICSVHNIKLSRFEKPIRHCAEYTRGRKTMLDPESSQDFFRMENQRLYLFQKAVGIRRNELRNLRCNDFVLDESSYKGCDNCFFIFQNTSFIQTLDNSIGCSRLPA